MNEQNNQIEMERMQRAAFAALLANIVSTEEELTHDQIKFRICTAIGRMIGDDEILVHDFIEATLVQFCQTHAEQHNAMVDVRRILEGEI